MNFDGKRNSCVFGASLCTWGGPRSTSHPRKQGKWQGISGQDRMRSGGRPPAINRGIYVSREVCMPRFAVLCSILLLSVLSFGQNERGIPGYCPYGCGPYIPLITTPSIAFSPVSPNPVGATNAVYTMPVWYSGGQTPRISPIAAGSPRWQAPPMPNASVHEREMRHQEMR